MVFKVLVLNRVYNFTIKCLEQGVFLDKPFKECEHLRWAAYICNTDIFFLTIISTILVRKIT